MEECVSILGITIIETHKMFTSFKTKDRISKCFVGLYYCNHKGKKIVENDWK